MSHKILLTLVTILSLVGCCNTNLVAQNKYKSGKTENANAKVWGNSMWGDLCGGDIYDDLALKNSGEIYGKYISIGVTIIKTDLIF